MLITVWVKGGSVNRESGEQNCEAYVVKNSKSRAPLKNSGILFRQTEPPLSTQNIFYIRYQCCPIKL